MSEEKKSTKRKKKVEVISDTIDLKESVEIMNEPVLPKGVDSRLFAEIKKGKHGKGSRLRMYCLKHGIDFDTLRSFL